MSLMNWVLVVLALAAVAAAYAGAQKYYPNPPTVPPAVEEPCRHCQGHGVRPLDLGHGEPVIYGVTPCDTCDGTGKTRTT